MRRIEYVRFEMRAEEEQQFLGDYQFAKRKLDECEDCLGYELCRAENGKFLLRIEWDSAAAAWPKNQTPAAVEKFLRSLKSALKAVREVGAYEPVVSPAPAGMIQQGVLQFAIERA
jgi:quinol monooxygenase YgiN